MKVKPSQPAQSAAPTCRGDVVCVCLYLITFDMFSFQFLHECPPQRTLIIHLPLSCSDSTEDKETEARAELDGNDLLRNH